MSEIYPSHEQLGRVLAHLKLKTGQHPAPQGIVPLREADEKLLAEAERLLAETEPPKAGQPSFSGLAALACSHEALYFEQLSPYLKLLFQGLGDPAGDQEAVFLHTNSCMHCFEAYTEVNRAFLDHLPLDLETDPGSATPD